MSHWLMPLRRLANRHRNTIMKTLFFFMLSALLAFYASADS